MTQGELKAWIAHTAESKQRWMLDHIRLHNHGEYLYYFGGEDGHYVWIDKTGEFRVGDYEGAYPHIGEAIFHTKFVKQFPSKEAAYARLIEVVPGLAI